MSSRHAHIDALRAVAALSVATHHWLIAAHHPAGAWLNAWFDLGHFGVIVFFVISGRLIPASAAHHDRRTFLLRRWFRIMPLYLVALAVFLVLRPADPATVAANLLPIAALLGAAVVVPGAWTLAYEEVLYLLATLGRRAFAAPVRTAGALIGLSLVLGLVGAPDSALGRVPLYLGVMAVGLVAGRSRVLCVLGALAPALYGDTYAPGILLARVAGVAVGVALLHPWPAPRALAWLGERSYSLYLFHLLPALLLPAAPLLWPPLALGLAVAGYAVIERPGMRLTPPPTTGALRTDHYLRRSGWRRSPPDRPSGSRCGRRCDRPRSSRRRG